MWRSPAPDSTSPPVVVAFEQALLLELGEERLEVDRLVDVALLLQVAHPLHGLFGVARGGEQQLVEEAHEVDPRQHLAQQVGVEMEVAVAHRLFESDLGGGRG